jgi:uncharacterized protein YndB with AHSA1/START domain
VSSTQTDLTVRRDVVVEAPAERAFEVFTSGIASWWPLATHSLEGDAATDVAIEPHVGGAVYEDGPKGRQEWGEVTAWEPPSRLAFTWHLGRPEQQTEVEVTFTPVGGATRVELVHSGWERLEDGVDKSAGYTQGWAMILDRYAGVAAA